MVASLDSRNFVKLIGEDRLTMDSLMRNLERRDRHLIGERRIQAPWDKVEFFVDWIPVDKEVVLIVGIAVPKTDQALNRPKL